MQKKPPRNTPMEPIEELVRLQAIQIRLQLASQRAAILELDAAGFSPKRIGELLHTTPNTVSVTVLQEKKKAAKKPAARGGAPRKSAANDDTS